MEILENSSDQQQSSIQDEQNLGRGLRRTLLIVNCVFLVTGDVGGPLLLRLYYRNGGERIWLPSFLQTAGFPLLLIPLVLSYINRRRLSSSSGSKQPRLFFITPRIFLACSILGFLVGADDYLYAHGMTFLPVSTTTLLFATQLAFTAFFAFLLVKQKFTPFSANAVALLTLGAVVLAFHTRSDRPTGVTKEHYFLGFFMTIGSAALYGLLLPLVELTYRNAKQRITYTLVMEMEFVMGLFATVFCTVGMLANKDYQEIPGEAVNYTFGESKYYIVLVLTAVIWQLFFLGAVGVVWCGSSLLAGITIASLVPVVEVLAVVLYKEKFTSEKGMSLALCLWGFLSYYYGEAKRNKSKIVEEQPISAVVTTP